MRILYLFILQGVIIFLINLFKYYTNNYLDLLEKNKSKDFPLNHDEINKLKNELMLANKIIELQNEKIKDLENTIKTNSYKINELKNEINLKNQEINGLKIKLKNYNTNKGEEKVGLSEYKSIQFISQDKQINYIIPCINTDLFAEIEEKLYKQYPEYRETNNFFLSKGKEIFRFKSISENKIESDFPVIIFVPD